MKISSQLVAALSGGQARVHIAGWTQPIGGTVTPGVSCNENDEDVECLIVTRDGVEVWVPHDRVEAITLR